MAAYCLAHGLDMHEAGETELARIWTKVEQIRAKQAAKPRHSPLPVPASEPEPVAQNEEREFTLFETLQIETGASPQKIRAARQANPVPTPGGAVEALLDTRPAFWKHKRAHGHQYAVKQLHFPTKEAGLQWIEKYHPQQKPDALAGWADEAPFFGTNIWADIEPATLKAEDSQ